MKRFFLHLGVLPLLLAALVTEAQQLSLTLPVIGGNRKASVAERIGITDVSIHYDRPGVKGRAGKIFGTDIVHYGFVDQGFGSSKAAPWRAGANENTLFTCGTPVMIEGKPLPAGTYGFFIAVGIEECTLIFSKNTGSWGSFFYNESEDALRVKVKPLKDQPMVEWLKYEFSDQTENAATVALYWEKWKIPFVVSTDLTALQIASFRNELRGQKGLSWDNFNYAANYCAQRNTNLEEALSWARKATGDDGFPGVASFTTYMTKANVLEKLGRTTQADSARKAAMERATMVEMHQYARSLLAQKKTADALELFKTNAAKYPNQFTTLMGLTRGYSANGDNKNALKFARQALALAPDAQNKTFVEGLIKKLEKGESIN
jgi:tetratricopeptide (TPR) repeat protein